MTVQAAVTEPLVRDLIVVEESSPTAKKSFLFNHTTLFSTKGLEESLHYFTIAIFVAWVNPDFARSDVSSFPSTSTLSESRTRSLHVQRAV